MNFDEIKDELNNPSFNIDLAKLLMKIHSENLINGYHLKAILKRQIQILELQKGKTGQELDVTVQKEIENLNAKFSEWLKEDFIKDINDMNPE
ncbi:hypothetical protein [Psychroserpens jangbogonensis]|uniref:hypothetical protein n=1 Tax=Psychroserpens jangbogonensis TaxID=1484460 RepID=UPI00053D66F7|nr:hypothetical protein [Psychroserpens jangbogonensis]